MLFRRGPIHAKGIDGQQAALSYTFVFELYLSPSMLGKNIPIHALFYQEPLFPIDESRIKGENTISRA